VLWVSYTEKIIFFCILKVTEERSQIRIRTKMSQIPNTGNKLSLRLLALFDSCHFRKVQAKVKRVILFAADGTARPVRSCGRRTGQLDGTRHGRTGLLRRRGCSAHRANLQWKVRTHLTKRFLTDTRYGFHILDTRYYRCQLSF
jgi:hypothetical protein